MAGNVFAVSQAWRTAYPGAVAGALALCDVANPERHPTLDARKEELERSLRARFAGRAAAALRDLPPLPAYEAYYKRYKKTYHVRLQLASVALKGKAIPGVAALVEAMFVAELQNLLLTAGHDLDSLAGPVLLDVAHGAETYTLLNGQEQTLKAGDMYMRDELGVISSVLYGPDWRTRLRPQTRRALFTVYAPPGVGEEAVRRHLEDLRANVQLVVPAATVELLATHRAG